MAEDSKTEKKSFVRTTLTTDLEKQDEQARKLEIQQMYQAPRLDLGLKEKKINTNKTST